MNKRDEADYGEIAWELVRRNLGQVRYEEICQQFELSASNRELLRELTAEWRPSYTVEDIVSLCEAYKGRPNIGRVRQALKVTARETARISGLRRQSWPPQPNNGDD